MTFTEAAMEVLRLVGKPLHYKKITEIAIERNLLSHVGKTPEITMSSRLATMVKKDRGEAPIVKVKPGVFGLRDFDEGVLAAAQKESGHDYVLPAEQPDETRRPSRVVVRERDREVSEGDESAEAPENGEGEGEEVEEARPSRPSKKLPGQDVFAEEDDDDQPILAGLDESRGGGGAGGAGDDGGARKKRRRRRRKKGGRDGEGRDEGGEDLDADRDRDHGGRDRDRDRGGRDRDRDRGGRDRDRGGRDRDRGGRDRDRDRDRAGRDRDRGGRDRDRDRDRGGRDRGRRGAQVVSGSWDREPGEGDVLGHDLADAIRDVLSNGPQRGLGHRRIAELLVRRNKLAGDPATLAPTVAAAVRGDVARRVVAGAMPRFREVAGEVELVEWALPRDAIRAEQDAVRSAERQRDLTRRAFLRRVEDLPLAGLAELLATWLNAEGVVQLRAVRRPGASTRAFHLAGLLTRGFEQVRLAVVFFRDGSEVRREEVVDVRGALHHYDNASAAWLITTGQVLSGARDEAGAPGMAPCGLFDGLELARAMERVGVGLTRHTVPVVSIDLDLLDALGRGQGTPSRDVDRKREEGPRGSDRGAEDEGLVAGDETGEGEARASEESGDTDVRESLRDEEGVTDDSDEALDREAEDHLRDSDVADEREEEDDDDLGDEDDLDDEEEDDDGGADEEDEAGRASYDEIEEESDEDAEGTSSSDDEE